MSSKFFYFSLFFHHTGFKNAFFRSSTASAALLAPGIQEA